MLKITSMKLKEIWFKIYNIICLVLSYVFNRYATLLPLSFFIPSLAAPQIFNKLKNYYELYSGLSLELLSTVGIVFITIIIWCVFAIIIFSCLTWIIDRINKICTEMKTFYVGKYKEFCHSSPQSRNNIPVKTEFISYLQSIELIKQSSYGLQAKSDAIKAGTLKELGGNFVTKQFAFKHFLSGEQYKEYLPSTQDKMELKKEEQLYDLIFQEFSSVYCYINSDNQPKSEPLYIKDNINIEANKLKQFLREKELELQ